MMRSTPLLVALLLAGCAGTPHGIAGKPGDAAKEVVKLGVIESIKPIELDASSGAGSTAGSIFGQAGGANAGAGRGAAVGMILGSVVGGTLGHQAGIATKPGLEIWVKLDEEGNSSYVMQPGKPDDFKVGDHVRVVRKQGTVRVEPITAAETPKQPAPPR